MNKKTKTIYWAGDLFNFKDLTGNVEMASLVEELSGGRYQVKLPQLSESNSLRTVREIRDGDLELLISCDVMVGNFDGSDLDSGTVVEFCFAKMLDMPVVLLRTDFRSTGDQGAGGDPWNLMCSGYPRTETLCFHGMSLFHEHFKKEGSPREKLDAYRRDIAGKVIAALDQICRERSLFPPEDLEAHYRRIIHAAGGGLGELFPPERLKKLIASKLEKME